MPLPFNERIYDYFGVPVQAKIRYIWLIVDVPGKIGFPLNIYPIKQPKPQISIDLV